jgi:alanine-alpha-ketoisovalerate/valine-pyruvate aminotransferase
MPWEPVLDKIRRDLECWERSRPILLSRKIIIQTVVDNYTQFLAKAQGMPPLIKKALTKMIYNFMWEDDSSLRITLNFLCLSLSKKGLNLFDIQFRNEAIEIM